MDKELKQRIKEDEFAHGVEVAGTWMSGHSRALALGIGIVLATLIVGVGVRSFQESKREKAEVVFSTALATWSAPVLAKPPAEGNPTGPVFKTAEEKYTKAVAEFDALAKEHGSSPAGRRARYYAALSRAELGQSAEAEKGLAELADKDRSSIEGGLARLALANLYRSTGQLDKAAAAYRQVADDADGSLPKDHALMQLAEVQERAKKGAEAAAAYQRLLETFPTSVYATEAKRKLDQLKPTLVG